MWFLSRKRCSKRKFHFAANQLHVALKVWLSVCASCESCARNSFNWNVKQLLQLIWITKPPSKVPLRGKCDWKKIPGENRQQTKVNQSIDDQLRTINEIIIMDSLSSPNGIHLPNNHYRNDHHSLAQVPISLFPSQSRIGYSPTNWFTILLFHIDGWSCLANGGAATTVIVVFTTKFNLIFMFRLEKKKNFRFDLQATHKRLIKRLLRFVVLSHLNNLCNDGDAVLPQGTLLSGHSHSSWITPFIFCVSSGGKLSNGFRCWRSICD